MSTSRFRENACPAIAMLAVWCAAVVSQQGHANPAVPATAAAPTRTSACPGDDSGLKLPAGFCATVFADEIGHARHLAVASDGVVYVNTWSGVYYGNDVPPAGGFLVALQDTSGRGKADVTQRFGETVQSGGAGGTGIGIYKGALYAEITTKSCAMRCRPDRSFREIRRKPWLPACPSGETTRCIRLRSMPLASCTWMSARQRIPANRKIAF